MGTKEKNWDHQARTGNENTKAIIMKKRKYGEWCGRRRSIGVVEMNWNEENGKNMKASKERKNMKANKEIKDGLKKERKEMTGKAINHK
uniref:Uncharacterized protein n=1 Tax=Romanomermis culicivorax TaxID=13658 RepID=A0A915KFF8_ROMCU